MDQISSLPERKADGARVGAAAGLASGLCLEGIFRFVLAKL
jgi:hypothetical protein